MTKKLEINFDMDGTLADFYGVEGWLDYLLNEDTTPYEIAKPLFNFSAFARQIHRLQRVDYKINIISWLPKNANDEYKELVSTVKKNWLKKHLPSVNFDNIIIIDYNTPKSLFGKGILFDDEINNRLNWGENAYDVNNILEVLRGLN